MNITKKQSLNFIKLMQKELIKIGADPFISDNLQFDLNTNFGVLWLRIDEDNKTCFTLYSRFLEPEKAPKLDFINGYSGKFNHHLTGEVKAVVASIISNINFVINLKP